MIKRILVLILAIGLLIVYLSFNLGYKYGRVSCVNSVRQLFETGKALKHCIMTNKYYAKDSLILFAEMNGQLIETAEVDLKRKEIIQCRGFGNKATPHNEVIVSLINQNIHLLNKAI